MDLERKQFQEWITNNWLPKYHNFSIKENGTYFYDAMEDAWEVWLGAKGYVTVQDNEK